MYDNIIKTYELKYIINNLLSLDLTTNERETFLHIKLVPNTNNCPLCLSDYNKWLHKIKINILYFHN